MLCHSYRDQNHLAVEKTLRSNPKLTVKTYKKYLFIYSILHASKYHDYVMSHIIFHV